jgi:hypothetical protein
MWNEQKTIKLVNEAQHIHPKKMQNLNWGYGKFVIDASTEFTHQLVT